MDGISFNHTMGSQTSLSMAVIKGHNAVIKSFLAKDGVQHIYGNFHTRKDTFHDYQCTRPARIFGESLAENN